MQIQRIKALNPDTTTGKSKDLFNAVQRKLGMVPNMMRTMGNSPAVLSGYLSFSGALAESSLGTKLEEQIALTVANINGCEYCNAAHSFIGEKLAGLSLDTIENARVANSVDPKSQAALSFAKLMVIERGRVSASDIESLKQAGFDEAAIAEIIAHTALNIFTNYFNNAVGTVVDFPKVELAAVGAY